MDASSLAGGSNINPAPCLTSESRRKRVQPEWPPRLSSLRVAAGGLKPPWNRFGSEVDGEGSTGSDGARARRRGGDRGAAVRIERRAGAAQAVVARGLGAEGVALREPRHDGHLGLDDEILCGGRAALRQGLDEVH